MKKIRFMDVSFRDGFQSVVGARAKTEDFLPALQAAVEAGTTHFEIGGGARFQSLYFYCQEDAFDMMDTCRKVVGPDINLQTLARGVNVVALSSQSRDIINLHAKLFKKHSVTTIRNFDALNDVRNLDYSGHCIHNNGLKHQVAITLMGLPPGLDSEYAHTPKYYVDCLRQIMDAGIPFDSVCFKDASGTTTPVVVFETVKGARKLLGDDITIDFHTHCTAGIAGEAQFAAIEGGADMIDLSMVPVSGGTGAPDILTMWHRLKGTNYTLDIDYEKYLKAEEVFMEAMDKYFMPPEAKEVNPLITLSPMPGGALTANTQMMRDNNCLHLYPKVIKAMREVVERGGFGTSVTPVSQFYFQQAFANVTQGEWKKITEGYGKMVLGYFGKTPSTPDPEIVKLASQQLGMEPTTESPVDIDDRNPNLGIEACRKQLKAAGMPDTEENIFIVASCGDKGLAFLKGDRPMGIRYKDEEPKEAAKPAAKPAAAAPAAPAAAASSGPESYTVTVNGKQYHVEVAPSVGGAPAPVTKVSAVAAAPAPAPAAAGPSHNIESPMPGSVLRVSVSEGDSIKSGDTLMVIEAMKMEVEIKAPAAGTVTSLTVSVGDTLESGQIVATIA